METQVKAPEQTPPGFNWAALQSSGNGIPTLGQTVVWYMDGLSVRHDDLDAAMRAEGLEEFIPKPPSARVALHRALEAMIRSAGSSQQLSWFMDAEEEGERKRPLIRTVNDYSKEWLVFALVQETADLARLNLRYSTSLRIKLGKSSGQVVCTTTDEGDINALNESRAVARLLDPHWDHYRGLHTPPDISKMLRGVVGWAAAISVRREGGIYFVPRENTAVLDKCRALIDGLAARHGGQPLFLSFGVPDEPRTRSQMGLAAHRALLAEVDALEQEISGLAAPGANPRAETVQERLVQANQARQKVELYEDLLGIQTAEVERRIASLKGAARRLLLA